ncbi:hypothetical protein [Paenibacillus methanolicus]|uniref:Uncharacterized protein n=1 Tax=Paenibacillus methanolicus TaxID=582686 RepID=A0A5S5C657_9BACL|nr:hypothetical protein [Paenibacillus methanolicus]TYP74824.1 hypothetical protein BCM02_105371 [Paenibacillus methanolicus]
MSLITLRIIASGMALAAIAAFTVDGLLVSYRQPYDGFGILATFILPPVGIVAASIANKRSDAAKDLLLICLNILAFFTFGLYMFFGTLFWGP